MPTCTHAGGARRRLTPRAESAPRAAIADLAAIAKLAACAVWPCVQALDLLGRKIMLQKLKPINEHCRELYAQCRPLLFSSDAGLRKRAWSLLSHTAEWQLLTYRIGMKAASDK